MITRKQVELLAKFETSDMPIVSFYLDIDASHYSPHQNMVRARHLISGAERAMSNQGWSDEAKTFIHSDLDYVTQFIETEFENSYDRGLAIFSSTARQFGVFHKMPCTVGDSITVRRYAVIRPLATMLCDFSSYAIALVDRENARIFRVKGDRIAEVESVRDNVHQRFHVGEDAKHVERHIDNQEQVHLRHAACRLAELVETDNLDTAILSASPRLMPDLWRHLPPPLTKKSIIVPHHIQIDLPESEILTKAQEAYAQYKCREQTQLISLLEDTAARGGPASVGMPATMRALCNKSVRMLVLQRETEAFDERLEEALRLAFQQGVEVKFVSGLSDWTLNGGIGAMLRY